MNENADFQAESPDRFALGRLGLSRALNCHPDEAPVRLAALAQYGLAEAQVAFGQYLLLGEHGVPDRASAYKWFDRAAQSGDPAGMNMLGRCLERGWGCMADPTAAVQWYENAAVKGLDWAQYNLANALLRGRGAPQSRPAAYRWFLQAAEQGHAKSMNLVARFLEEGWDMEPDDAAALDWYCRAAEAGDYRGQFNWGTCLAREGQIAAAAKWFLRAASHATPDLLPIMAQALGDNPDYAVAAAIVRGRLSPEPPEPDAITDNAAVD